MSAHEYTAAEAVTAAVAHIRASQGLVTIDQDGYVEMQTEAGCEPYGFEVTGVGDALRWIEHIAQRAGARLCTSRCSPRWWPSTSA